jgi:hypothetical protein
MAHIIINSFSALREQAYLAFFNARRYRSFAKITLNCPPAASGHCHELRKELEFSWVIRVF